MEDSQESLTALLEKQYAELLVRQEAMGDNLYRQLEALHAITAILPVRYPLPPMRGWAISPDFGALLVAEIIDRRPHLVVELGSGVSTLLIAYCLEQLGQGRVISYDHDADYCAKTRENINRHKLGQFAEVVHAPLVKVQLEQDHWDWYDTTLMETSEQTDVLVIDGPPGQIQKLSRYPALPLLYKQLANKAAILLDDAARSDEKQIVDRWTSEFTDLSHEYLPLEKGASILRYRK